MIVGRTIFYAKWNRVDELKSMMHGMFDGERPEGMRGARLLTDLSGRFYRLVIEVEFDTLASWEVWRNAAFVGGDAGDSTPPDPMRDLVEWGEQEFYTLEASIEG